METEALERHSRSVGTSIPSSESPHGLSFPIGCPCMGTALPAQRPPQGLGHPPRCWETMKAELTSSLSTLKKRSSATLLTEDKGQILTSEGRSGPCQGLESRPLTGQMVSRGPHTQGTEGDLGRDPGGWGHPAALPVPEPLGAPPPRSPTRLGPAG